MSSDGRAAAASKSEQMIGEARRLYLERLGRLPFYVPPAVSSVPLSEREAGTPAPTEPKQRA